MSNNKFKDSIAQVERDIAGIYSEFLKTHFNEVSGSNENFSLFMKSIDLHKALAKTQVELAEIVGISPATLSRVFADPNARMHQRNRKKTVELLQIRLDAAM